VHAVLLRKCSLVWGATATERVPSILVAGICEGSIQHTPMRAVGLVVQARGGHIVIKVRHRSLEITSPGGLVSGLRAEALGTTASFSCPRNPLLSWYMHTVEDPIRGGKVFEGHGLGVARARRLIESYGGKLTFQELPEGAVMAMVKAPKSPSPTRASESQL
jgi:hypothetical protein